MLSPLKELLTNYRIILASSSPQRKSILEQVGLKFDTIPSDFDEESVKLKDHDTPYEYIEEIAKNKTRTVANSIETNQPTIVVGADTMIIDGKNVVGKPHTPDRATKMITRWSDGTHDVCTGVCIIIQKQTHKYEKNFHVVSTVKFPKLSPETIKSYVDTGEGLNKAGAYDLQGIAAAMVESISGDYFNVMGFPIQKFFVNLTEMLEGFEKDWRES